MNEARAHGLDGTRMDLQSKFHPVLLNGVYSYNSGEPENITCAPFQAYQLRQLQRAARRLQHPRGPSPVCPRCCTTLNGDGAVECTRRNDVMRRRKGIERSEWRAQFGPRLTRHHRWKRPA